MDIIDLKVKLSEYKIIKLEISTFSTTRYVLHLNIHNIILFYEETIRYCYYCIRLFVFKMVCNK